jgi:hypothetical protein
VPLSTARMPGAIDPGFDPAARDSYLQSAGFDLN